MGTLSEHEQTMLLLSKLVGCCEILVDRSNLQKNRQRATDIIRETLDDLYNLGFFARPTSRNPIPEEGN